MRWIAVSAAATCLLLNGMATAQDAPKAPSKAPEVKTPEVKGDRHDEVLGRVLRVTKLNDCTVKNLKGEKIGEIEDLVIDRDEGVVAYGVLSFGGFLGIGEKLFAVPFNSLTRTKDEGVVVMDVTKEQLERAPSFAKDSWPEFDRAYGTTLSEFYKTTPYWQVRADAAQDPARLPKDALDKDHLRAHGCCRATQAIGMKVEDTTGKNLGDVNDLVVDDATGRVVYGVLSFGGFLGMGDKLFAIPWHALRQSAKADDKFVLDVPKDKLEAAPGFDKKTWPNMADHRWGLDIHKYYGENPYWDAKGEHHGTPSGS
jgi:sporulation protein YlmC with PRC-barrel domain